MSRYVGFTDPASMAKIIAAPMPLGPRPVVSLGSPSPGVIAVACVTVCDGCGRIGQGHAPRFFDAVGEDIHACSDGCAAALAAARAAAVAAGQDPSSVAPSGPAKPSDTLSAQIAQALAKAGARFVPASP